MPDILHRVAIVAPSPGAVYSAITTVTGLAGWWAENTQGRAVTGVGDVLQFRFVPGGFDIKVTELVPSKLVRWEVVEGPAEWIGTTISWELRQDGAYTVVLFTHAGWKEPSEFMHHCSTKWASYLMSMKSLVETGKGAPDPHDVQIGDWH